MKWWPRWLGVVDSSISMMVGDELMISSERRLTFRLHQSEREFHAELCMSHWKRLEANQCSNTCGSKEDDSKHAEHVYEEGEEAHGKGSNCMVIDGD